MKVTIEVRVPSPFLKPVFREFVRTKGQLRKEKAAQLVCLSISQFGGKFQRLTGVTFETMRLQVKLEIGRELLHAMSVAQVAETLGYGHRSKFETAFKHLFGVGFIDVFVYDNLTVNSTESDSIQLETGTYFNGSNSTATLTLRDGTKVQWTNAAAPRISVITLNGNKLTASKNWPTSLPSADTTGRSIGYSQTGTVETITLQDSNGQNKTYTINTASRTGMDPTLISAVSIGSSKPLPRTILAAI